MGHESPAAVAAPDSVNVPPNDLVERVALVLYQAGYRGRSATDFQFRTEHHEWYSGIARKVLSEVATVTAQDSPNRSPLMTQKA